MDNRCRRFKFYQKNAFEVGIEIDKIIFINRTYKSQIIKILTMNELLNIQGTILIPVTTSVDITDTKTYILIKIFKECKI